MGMIVLAFILWFFFILAALALKAWQAYWDH